MIRFVVTLSFALLGFIAVLVAGAFRDESAVARQTLPVQFLMPTRLPPGTALLHWSYQAQPDGSQDADFFYRLPSGSIVHIWETTRTPAQLRPKNPLDLPGTVHAGSLGGWLEGKGMSGRVTTLAAVVRGVLVDLDAPLTVQDLLSIAESLR